MKWWKIAINLLFVGKRVVGSFCLPREVKAIAKKLIILVLVLSVSSCADKAVGKEVSIISPQKPQQISQQFSETSPPQVIQQLRSYTEVYQPQVTILTPQADEILQSDTVTVSLQVKDLPIFKDPKSNLGSHLHLILDNQPYISVYDLNQPLVLPNLSPGTHTLRVFASRPWDESFKNEGAYAQTRFHIFAKTDDNNPDPALPLLTYNRPQGNYGAEPILLDFYLTNAPLRLVAKENLKNNVADWRIRCTINGESFILDRWQAIYLKGFKPGKNWLKLEFLDEQGNPVKNVFNSTIRLITYQPKGRDTLSRIVRGELSADQVRSIVDQNYSAKPPTVEPIPETKVEEPPKAPSTELTQPKQSEKANEGEVINPEQVPTPTPSPSLSPLAPPKPEESQKSTEPKVEGYLKPRPVPTATPSPVSPILPEIIESEQPSTIPDESQKSTKPRFGGYFQRRQVPTLRPSPISPTEEPEITPESPDSQKSD